MNRRTTLLRIVLFFSLVAVAVVASFKFSDTPDSEAAGAVLSFPTATCSDDGAQVTYDWLPIDGAQEQWIDITTADNGFVPGSYSSTQLSGTASKYTAAAINPHWPHFWRVNSRTANGWQVSTTGMFTPCDWPVLLIGGVYCQTSTQARAELRWAPRADSIGYQWLEISQDGSFADSGIVRVGPLAFGSQGFSRGGFVVGQEYAFRAVWQDSAGNRVPTQVGWFTPTCTATAINSVLYSSSDRLVSASLGINAPVNVRDVGVGGELGVPSGAFDVVRYNFGEFTGLGGYPGEGGVTMIGGHVDYYTVGLAVFAPLRNAQIGDTVRYVTADGSTITYVVDWVRDLPFSTDLSPYLSRRGNDELILVTCNGTFDQALRRYDLRRLVHASRAY
jgi:hypothetical protein